MEPPLTLLFCGCFLCLSCKGGLIWWLAAVCPLYIAPCVGRQWAVSTTPCRLGNAQRFALWVVGSVGTVVGG